MTRNKIAYSRSDRIFYTTIYIALTVLSLLILFTNLIARAVFRRLAKASESRQSTAKIYKFSAKKAA